MQLVFAAALAVLLLLVNTLLVSVPVWQLWNWLAPTLHLPTLDLLQAAGLILMFRLLTSSAVTVKTD